MNQVVPEAELAQATRALANEIASNAPLAVQSAKRMMRMGLSEPFGEHVHHVFLQLLPLFQSQDFREGMVSFIANDQVGLKIGGEILKAFAAQRCD
mgnify:CR=1 FL=1